MTLPILHTHREGAQEAALRLGLDSDGFPRGGPRMPSSAPPGAGLFKGLKTKKKKAGRPRKSTSGSTSSEAAAGSGGGGGSGGSDEWSDEKLSASVHTPSWGVSPPCPRCSRLHYIRQTSFGTSHMWPGRVYPARGSLCIVPHLACSFVACAAWHLCQSVPRRAVC